MVFLDGLLGMRTWYCWFDDRYIPWVQCTLVEGTVLLRKFKCFHDQLKTVFMDG